jgi:hypothetical protein
VLILDNDIDVRFRLPKPESESLPCPVQSSPSIRRYTTMLWHHCTVGFLDEKDAYNI